MKHICLISEHDRASMYGIGTYIRQLSECILSMNNTTLHLININCYIDEVKITHFENYIEYSFPYISDTLTDYDYRNIWLIFKLNLKINKEDELVVHLNCMHQYHLAKCIKESQPQSHIILTVHYLLWSLYLKGNLTHLQSILKNIVPDIWNIKSLIKDDDKIFGIVDKIVCLSCYTRNILIDIYGIPDAKIRIVYNGLKDEYESLGLHDKNNLRNELGFSKNEKIILFVGRLDEVKGVEVLIDAFKLTLGKKKNSKLVIVGEGNYSLYLSKCKNYWHKIIFTGRLEKEDLYKIYKIADLGVMTSMHEQCSYVAIEMLMFNIPLIITTTTGLNEVLDNESNKVKVIEYYNKVEISKTELSKKMLLGMNSRKNYREIYINKYSLETMYNNMAFIYNI